MKKVVFGSILCLAGMISCALMLSGAMLHDWTIDGEYSIIWILSRYNAIHILMIFVIIAVVGTGVAIWGMFEK